MRRRALIVGIGIFLVIGIFVTLAYILFPFYEEEFYRDSLEASFSATLGRTVSLEGPLSLTFSLQPRLILEEVSVSNPPWTSHPHLFRADRLEIGLSLWPLLRRRLEVEKIALEGAELLLEERAEGLDNWTFGKDATPGMLSRAVPSVFMTISQRGEITIERSRIMYRPYPDEETTEVLIHRGLVTAPDDQHRKFSFEGTYHDSPVSIELIGGRIMDLFDLTEEAWPVDGVLSTTGASASIKGRVGGANSNQKFDLQVQVNGDHLSALNGLLKTNFPAMGPFDIAGDVVLNTERTNVNNLRLNLGSSDLAGHVSLHQEEGRQKLSGTLTADVIQVNDFLIPANATSSVVSAQQAPSPVPGFLLPFDGDLDVTVNTWRLGNVVLGSTSLMATIREKRLDVPRFQGKGFGGILKANLEIDLQNTQPQTSVTAKVTSFNFGQALKAFGVTEGIAGSTDLDVKALGYGTSLQEFLTGLTLNLQTDRTTLALSGSISENRLPVAFPRISLSTSKGGPIDIQGKGTFQEKTFGARLMTASPIELIKPEKPWPVSFIGQMGDAVLVAKGTVNAERPGMGAMLTVSLKGKQLNELDSTLPPVGPYHFIAQVSKEGSRYRVNDFQSRFGTSDLSGSLEIDTEKDKPQLTGSFTAEHLNFKELSTPGDIPVPAEAIGAVNADLKMLIHQAEIGAG